MRGWRMLIRSVRKIRERCIDSAVCFSHAHLIRNIAESHEYELEIRDPGDKDLISIAFRPTGGLGDYIICSKLMDELMTEIPCRFDVYCEHVLFGNAVYKGRPGVRVVPFNQYEDRRFKYDLSLLVEHFIHVERINAFKLARFNPKLTDKLNDLVRGYFDIYPDIPEQWYREAIHFMRCQVKEINRWTELRHIDIFRIPDQRTWIPMDQSYRKQLGRLGLEGVSYLTFNRGADSMGRSVMQTKVWPAEYYVRLAGMIKDQFPDIRIVQVGGKKNVKIPGVDQYVFGESLEITKWILKNSLLHVDCEGGLAHLATQLSTMCAVLFGPTPMHFYQYPWNINIASEVCGNCMGLHKDWAFSCYLDQKEAKCMLSITPERVFGEIKQHLKNGRDRNIKSPYVIRCGNLEKKEVRKELCGSYTEWNKRYGFLSCQKVRLPYYEACLHVLEKEKKKNKKVLMTGFGNDPFPLMLAAMGYDHITVLDSKFGCTGAAGDVTHCLYMGLCLKQGIEARLGDEMCKPVDIGEIDIEFCWDRNTEEIS